MQVEKRVPASRWQEARKVALRCLSVTEQPKVHVIGVAGSGLRGLVHLLSERGVKITGSEMLESPVLQGFRRRGIDCHVGHSSDNVDQQTHLVLISAAVTEANPEVRAAQAMRIPVLKYAELLGCLMAEKAGIAVAGTHGKTTTTAMISYILRETGRDPSFVVGGEHPALGGSSRAGKGPHFVAEACEFDRSFLNLRPRISVVTNIEEDHLDYFESLRDIQNAFAEFVSLLPEDGLLVVHRDDPNSAYLSEFCRSRVATFSLRPGAADWWAEDVQPAAGGIRFRACGQDGRAAEIRLLVPGPHNVLNALAATAVCTHVGVPLEDVAEALASFTGVRRRFDILAREPVMVVDDYAHHPTEMAAVLRAARQSLAGRRLVAVFQPHQHSRLRVFREKFAAVLVEFDAALVVDVYRARDKDEDARQVQSDSLVRAVQLRAPSLPAFHTPSFDDALRELARLALPDDAVIFMGAGDITDLSRRYAESLRGASV